MLQEHHRDTHTPILVSVQLSVYTIPLIKQGLIFQFRKTYFRNLIISYFV
jgi:hypothetical protein